ncbi:PQQ-dependent sugar dehydrogenase [Aquirufa rosea]|uniref:C-type cytochrome n=1 Tax=Aquirufa rosea TaxID=2509241 RepID=A0A4Q1BZ52_9BACT|nr:PQQ-dependent sugar dehydrogenase [Aquirufa rosea]RXK48779.1 c-type cytochrome [Aquirufa rosea]
MKILPSSVVFLRFFVFVLPLWAISFSGISQQINRGAQVFEMNCASCHNFKEDGIGPQLGGLKGVVDKQYLIDFINNPKGMIDAQVARAQDKFKKFKSYMPGFNHLDPQDIQDVIAYILEKPAPKLPNTKGKLALENPIVPKIAFSGETINLKKVIQFPITNSTEPKTRINKMTFHPITKDRVISDLQGKLYLLNSKNELSEYLDISKYFPHFTNKPGMATGLGSFAFHPLFAQNKLFYTTHTEPEIKGPADFTYGDSLRVKLQWIITEWTLDDAKSATVQGKSREIMRVNVIDQIHGMQEITFNPYAKVGDQDFGLLYIGMGDGGALEQRRGFIPNNIEHAWGKVLRIDPLGRNSQNGKYGIPASNPFVGKKGLDEVFAQGFRNPNRISWLKDGRIIVSNIGQRNIESLYLLQAGKNYGWPLREGTFAIDPSSTTNTVYPLPKDDAKMGYTYPIAQFDHDEGNAMMGGFEYTGKAIPALRGKYIFGEIVRGRIFYIPISEIKEGSQARIRELKLRLEGKEVTLKELSKSNKADLRLGQDAQGELYIITKVDGMLYQIVPNE